MVAFAYTARTKTGEKASGTVDAADKRVATQMIERMGYVPITVKESSAAAKEAKNGKDAKAEKKTVRTPRKPRAKKGEEGATKGPYGKMTLRETLDFSRELRDLVTSGMTIGQALDSLSKRSASNDVRKNIVGSLYEDITQGSTLSASLRKHPDTFSQFYSSMVKAGEESGQLPDSLDNIITHYERLNEAKETVKGALIYPIILLKLGIGAVIFIMVKVIPQFAQIFADLGTTLPPMTRLLIGMSNFVASFKGLIAAAAIVAGAIMFHAWTKTPAGQMTFHGWMLKIPVLKGIVASNAYAQFARTLGGLMRNGVPVLKAMTITEQATTNRVIAAEVNRAKERVADGASISGTLAQGGVFPELFVDMLSVGEQTGDVPKALDHVAERYDSELQQNISTFSKLIEPAFLLILAGAVGFVAIAMLQAVFQISSGLG